MEGVGYLNHADLLLEDENGVAVIGGGHYVLSLGDHVYFKHALDHEPTRISVQISFQIIPLTSTMIIISKFWLVSIQSSISIEISMEA